MGFSWGPGQTLLAMAMRLGRIRSVGMAREDARVLLTMAHLLFAPHVYCEPILSFQLSRPLGTQEFDISGRRVCFPQAENVAKTRSPPPGTSAIVELKVQEDIALLGTK